MFLIVLLCFNPGVPSPDSLSYETYSLLMTTLLKFCFDFRIVVYYLIIYNCDASGSNDSYVYNVGFLYIFIL